MRGSCTPADDENHHHPPAHARVPPLASAWVWGPIATVPDQDHAEEHEQEGGAQPDLEDDAVQQRQIPGSGAHDANQQPAHPPGLQHPANPPRDQPGAAHPPPALPPRPAIPPLVQIMPEERGEEKYLLSGMPQKDPPAGGSCVTLVWALEFQ